MAKNPGCAELHGGILAPEVLLVLPDPDDDFELLMSWADDVRRLGVRANVDTPQDAAPARRFGAAGIGICRTEHMFFSDERLEVMREMILANNLDGRREALAKLLPMQSQAILDAACDAAAAGVLAHPEVMVPLVGHHEELRRQIDVVRATADTVFAERERKVAYLAGTMIEVPRAALTADEIAAVAEFFSFGTNDLAQMTFGLSRIDACGFLPQYVESGIPPENPLQTLDQEGGGRLVEIALDLGRSDKPELKAGICGEHGSDPASVAFCHSVGLDHVFCSPYRVPIAGLAAAQAALAD